MDRALVCELIDYMYWVNHRLLDAAGRLSDTEFVAPSTLTTRDLRATLVHELDLEWSWRLTLEGRPESEWGPDAELRPLDFRTVDELRARWTTDEAEMRAWLDTQADEALATVVTSGLSRDRRPLGQFLLHIVTHAAQQQADAATLLTLAGQSPGQLDYLRFLAQR